jgi:hypothetical protein
MTIVPDKDFRVTLVNPDGSPCVLPDSSDPKNWPSTNEVDGWFWTVEDDERIALESAQHDYLTGLADAATPSERLAFQPSAEGIISSAVAEGLGFGHPA